MYHKGDATAGRGFFPKYDKRDYMDIAKMLLESAPRLLMRQDLKGRDPLALALELSASDIDPRLDMIVFLEEKKKQVRVLGGDSLTFFLRAVFLHVCVPHIQNSHGGNVYHCTTMLSVRASATPQSHLYRLSHGASSLSICVTRSYHRILRGPILHPSSSCK